MIARFRRSQRGRQRRTIGLADKHLRGADDEAGFRFGFCECPLPGYPCTATRPASPCSLRHDVPWTCHTTGGRTEAVTPSGTYAFQSPSTLYARSVWKKDHRACRNSDGYEKSPVPRGGGTGSSDCLDVLHGSRDRLTISVTTRQTVSRISVWGGPEKKFSRQAAELAKVLELLANVGLEGA